MENNPRRTWRSARKASAVAIATIGMLSLGAGVANALSGTNSCGGSWVLYTSGYNPAPGNYLFTSKIVGVEKNVFVSQGQSTAHTTGAKSGSWSVGSTAPGASLNGGCTN